MSARFRQLVGALACLLAAACGYETTQVVAPTQVLLSIDIEPTLRSEAQALRASLFVEGPKGFAERKSLTLQLPGLPLPIDLPILARSAEEESARFEVQLELLADDGEVMAASRVLSRFLPRRHALVVTTITRCANRAPGFTCESRVCHGDDCKVCSGAGECVPVAFITPSARDELAMGARHEDAGRSDGATPVSREGSDGARTPSTSDSSMVMPLPAAAEAGSLPTQPDDRPLPTQPDAGPLPPPAGDGGAPAAVAPGCPPDHGCAAPYPCTPTALGYTCRGQFADWPMPDSSPSSKRAQSYTSDSVTVVDQVTKLEWQSAIPRLLSGCTEQLRPSSGPAGPVGEFCTLLEARRYCEDLVHGEKSDWRLPSVTELVSLIDARPVASQFGIDENYFSIPGNFALFASSSTYPGSPAYFRVLNYFARATYPGTSAAVRCVRAGAEPPFATPRERYAIDSAADTVTDRATTLVWQRTVSPTVYTLEEIDGATHCPTGFRLPALNELATLVDPTKEMPAIDSVAFPNTPSATFWASRPSQRDQGVSFAKGDVEEWVSKAQVRCVR